MTSHLQSQQTSIVTNTTFISVKKPQTPLFTAASSSAPCQVESLDYQKLLLGKEVLFASRRHSHYSVRSLETWILFQRSINKIWFSCVEGIALHALNMLAMHVKIYVLRTFRLQAPSNLLFSTPLLWRLSVSAALFYISCGLVGRKAFSHF